MSAASPKPSPKNKLPARRQMGQGHFATAWTRRSPTISPRIRNYSAAWRSNLGRIRRHETAHGRPHRAFRRGQRSATRHAVFSVRALFVDLLFASRRPARDVAGFVERFHDAAVGQQIHHQHQHRDELLAGRALQFVRVRRAADRAWCWKWPQTGARTAKVHVWRARLGGAS